MPGSNILSIHDSYGNVITSGTVGEAVFIYGGGFGASQGNSTVTFGATPATVNTWTENQINTTVPSGATTGNVVVTVGGVDSNGYSFTVPGTPSSSIYYYIEDSLGSSRTIVQDGATAPCYDADFYPFGGERIIADTCPQNYKFEGKERDAETGNDDFGARYYSNRFGRFMSPDWSASPTAVPFADISNPQSLNLYAYVHNNPLSGTDPSGHCTVDGEKHGFWWCVGHAVGVEETQKEYQQRIETERQWLSQNAATNSAQTDALKNASDETIDGLYQKWNGALQKSQCPWYTICEEQPTDAMHLQRASDGSFVPLSRLHDDATITVGNSASYNYWKGKSTEEIIDSLKSAADQPLVVRPNGTVLDGNTRIKVLEERGVDINKLERVIRPLEEPLP